MHYFKCSDRPEPEPSETYTISVTNSGSGSYTLSGTDRNGSVSGANASVTLNNNDTINFTINASGHPFYIKSLNTTGLFYQVSGVTNQGTESETVSWTPTVSGTYYYNCRYHSSMNGTILVN